MHNQGLECIRDTLNRMSKLCLDMSKSLDIDIGPKVGREKFKHQYDMKWSKLDSLYNVLRSEQALYWSDFINEAKYNLPMIKKDNG